VLPACIGGTCPTGHDTLPPQALRLLEIRSLLVGLHDLHLADRICDEYGVDAEDLMILAEIEELLKEHAPQPKPGETNG
jgi:hypothetical protein